MLRVAVKDILARKRRLVTTALAIVLGISFLTGTQLLSAILKESIASVVAEAYQGYDAVVRSPEVQELGFGQRIHTPLESRVVDKVAGVSGVAAARGVIETISAQLIDYHGKVAGSGFGPATLTYNWLDDPGLQIGVIQSGHEPRADDQIVIDSATAESTGYRIGDEVTVATGAGSEQFDLVGLIGLGSDGTAPVGAKALVFTTPAAQRIGEIPGKFNYIAARAETGIDQQMLTQAISGAIPEVQVLTGAEFTAESQDSIAKIVDILSTFVQVFGYVALFVACFIIYNTFSILVAQRTRETALLRAIGASRRQVLGSTLLEAAVVGLLASVLGLLGGVVLASALRSVVGSIFSIGTGSPPLTATSVLTAFGVGIGVTVLSGLVPAWRSSKVAPMAAMSEVAVDHSAVSRIRIIWGSMMFVLGVALVAVGYSELGPTPLFEFGAGAALVLISVSLILGPLIVAPVSRLMTLRAVRRSAVVGRLAGQNAARNPKRTAATAAALTIGVTLVTLIATMAASIRASVDSAVASSVQADFILSTDVLSIGSSIPPGILEKVTSLPQVESATSIRVSPVRLTDAYGREHAAPADKSSQAEFTGPGGNAPPGEDDLILGVDPETIFDVIDFGRVEGSRSDLKEGTFAAVASVAEDRGWSIGERVPFYFAQTGIQKLKLVMTVSTDTAMGSYMLPMSTFEKNSLQLFDVDLVAYVRAREGSDLSKLREDLDDIVAGLPTVSVQNVSEYVDAQTAPFDTFLAVVYGLLILAVVIALIGITNTLSLSVLERTRELGLLRAVGMSRRQLRRSIIRESLIVAAFGTAVGLLLGLVFSAALSTVIATDSPQAFTFTLPVLSLVVIVVTAVAAGVIAAVAPAWRASRLDVLGAISTV